MRKRKREEDSAMSTQTIFLKYDVRSGGTEIGEYLGGNNINWFSAVGTEHWDDEQNCFVPDKNGTVFWEKGGDLDVQTFTHRGQPYLWRFSKQTGSSQIGKYEGDGDIIWYDATSFRQDYYTHAVTFNHGEDGHVLLHSSKTGYTQIGKYTKGRKFSWYKGVTWAKGWTDRIVFIECNGVATMMQWNFASGKVCVGEYVGVQDGKPAFKYFDSWAWAKNYGDHLHAFTYHGEPHLLKHDTRSGETYFAKYDGNGTLTWYPQLQWKSNYTTHLMMFNSAGESYILQHDYRTGGTQIGLYMGENQMQWFHSISTWAKHYCSVLVSFECRPLLTEDRKIEDQYLVCSSPIKSLEGENYMTLLDEMNDSMPHIRICFDWPGSSNKVESEEEAANWQLVEEAKTQGIDSVHKAVVKTLWYKLFAGQIKGSIKSAAQGGGKIKVVCLKGGPISQTEEREMPTIVEKTKGDLATLRVEADIDLCVFNNMGEFSKAVGVAGACGGAKNKSGYTNHTSVQ